MFVAQHKGLEYESAYHLLIDASRNSRASSFPFLENKVQLSCSKRREYVVPERMASSLKRVSQSVREDGRSCGSRSR